MTKIMYYLCKTSIVCLAVGFIYLTAHFWIGTKEAWDEQVNHHLLTFFFARFGVTVFMGMLFFLVSMIADWFFRKTIVRNRRKAAMEFFFVVFVSFFMVSLAIFVF
jgi:hypothetical protein